MITGYNHSEMDNSFTWRSQIRLSFSRIIWKPENHSKTYQISHANVPLSWNWYYHPGINPRTYLANFGKPDVSRV
jgi:hypothetical protein